MAQAKEPLLEESLTKGVLSTRPDGPPCGKHWPAFWFMVVCGMVPLVIFNGPFGQDIATAYFNGGVNPCVVGEEGSEACQRAQLEVTELTSMQMTASGIITFMCAPLTGRLSDRVGRKPVLFLSSVLALGSSSVVSCVYMFGLPVQLWYISIVLQAFVPGMVPFMAFLTDITLPDERIPLYAVLFSADVITAALTLIVVRFATPLQCIFFAMGCTLTVMPVILFVIPETRPAPVPAVATDQEAGAGAAEEAEPSDREGSGRDSKSGIMVVLSDKTFRLVLALLTSFAFVFGGSTSITFQYLKHRFGLTAQTVMPIQEAQIVCMFIVICFMVKPLSRWLGMKLLLILTVVLNMATCVATILAPSANCMYAINLVGAIGVAAIPALMALQANLAPVGKRAEFLGTFQSAQALATACGAGLFNHLFARYIGGESLSELYDPYCFATFVLALVLLLLLAIPAAVLDTETSSRGSGAAQVAN